MVRLFLYLKIQKPLNLRFENPCENAAQYKFNIKNGDNNNFYRTAKERDDKSGFIFVSKTFSLNHSREALHCRKSSCFMLLRR